jgi:hypothetical protein
LETLIMTCVPLDRQKSLAYLNFPLGSQNMLTLGFSPVARPLTTRHKNDRSLVGRSSKRNSEERDENPRTIYRLNV